MLRLDDDAAGGAATAFTDFLMDWGWLVVIALLVAFVVWSLAAGRQRARQRQIHADLTAQRLLAESMQELRGRTAEQTRGPSAD